MKCDLCETINEEQSVIKKGKTSFCVIVKAPLKEGHVMILPVKHIENYSELSEEESKEIFELIEEMVNLLKSRFEEDVIIHINRGKHSSQNHIHIHLVPSKGQLRELVSEFEGIPKRVIISKEEMRKIRDKILK